MQTQLKSDRELKNIFNCFNCGSTKLKNINCPLGRRLYENQEYFKCLDCGIIGLKFKVW